MAEIIVQSDTDSVVKLSIAEIRLIVDALRITGWGVGKLTTPAELGEGFWHHPSFRETKAEMIELADELKRAAHVAPTVVTDQGIEPIVLHLGPPPPIDE